MSKRERTVTPPAHVVRHWPRQRLLGDRTFILIAHVLRAADWLLEQHTDAHEPGCWCGHCESLRFEPFNELSGMRWPLSQMLSVIDCVTSAPFDAGDATKAETLGDALRRLAELSDAVDAAHWDDFAPLESLTGPQLPPDEHDAN